MFLRNINTGEMGQFLWHQGEGWVEYTEEEVLLENLEKAKTAKIIEIKAWRDAELIKPTPQTVNSYDDDDAPNIGNHSFKFASEDMSLLANILDKLRRLPNGRTRKWTSITGERVALTKSDFQSILDHMEARDESLFDIAQMNIDIVNELTSVKEVEDFEITFE